MISTVGDIRKAIEGIPDHVFVELDIDCDESNVTGIIEISKPPPKTSAIVITIEKCCYGGSWRK